MTRPAPLRAFTYTLSGGWTVRAGRSDEDNDRLSIKLAEPDDWWFHVRGMPGSHVVLHGPPGAEADRVCTLRAAAPSRRSTAKREREAWSPSRAREPAT